MCPRFFTPRRSLSHARWIGICRSHEYEESKGAIRYSIPTNLRLLRASMIILSMIAEA